MRIFQGKVLHHIEWEEGKIDRHRETPGWLSSVGGRGCKIAFGFETAPMCRRQAPGGGAVPLFNVRQQPDNRRSADRPSLSDAKCIRN